MTFLKETDYLFLETLFHSSQYTVHKIMKKILQKYYKESNVFETKDYLYAIGNIPIALVAHMDTVWEDKPPQLILYDRKQGVIWSPTGLGADDKAGLFIILKVLQAGLLPHIVLTHDEEIGGFGADELAAIDCPFDDLKFIVQLDRRGEKDCVFYHCKNKSFIKYIEKFGFKQAEGTFSDISILCPAWEVCGVNLSVGYLNEHTTQEMLFLDWMNDTLDKVKKILVAKNSKKFKWDKSWGHYYRYMDYYTNGNFSSVYGSNTVPCHHCHTYFPIINSIPVIKFKPSEYSDEAYVDYCPECFNNGVRKDGGNYLTVCKKCQCAFEDYNKNPKQICPMCEFEEQNVNFG